MSGHILPKRTKILAVLSRFVTEDTTLTAYEIKETVNFSMTEKRYTEFMKICSGRQLSVDEALDDAIGIWILKNEEYLTEVVTIEIPGGYTYKLVPLEEGD